MHQSSQLLSFDADICLKEFSPPSASGVSMSGSEIGVVEHAVIARQSCVLGNTKDIVILLFKSSES